MELDGSLLRDDLDAFHRQVRDAFTACRQAVDDELAGHHSPVEPGTTQSLGRSENRTRQSSHTNSRSANGNGSNGHRASEKQKNYINKLAGEIRGLGTRRLESLSQKMFNKPLADLASLDASALIDTLKAIQDGTLNLEDALAGAAV